MSPRSHIFLWLTATAAMAALTSWIVTNRPRPPDSSLKKSGGREAVALSLHEWMHRQLSLSPAQHTALEPLESYYEAERARLRADIGRLAKELALAMRDCAPDAGVLSIQVKLHAAQGELQQATLKHFIAMRQHLNPRQARELALWTHDSLLLQPAD